MCNTKCPFSHDGKYCISNIRLFKQLPLEVQKNLVMNSVQRSYARDSVIVSAGDEIENILIIKKGMAKIRTLDMDGDEHISDILHDGQAIWHGMFLEDHVYHYDVVCTTDVELCSISRQTFTDVIAKHPDIAMYLIEMLSTELQDADDKVYLLSIREPYYRLAGFLLNRDERCITGNIHLKLDEIAGSIALRPETVSRNLAKMEKDKLIERQGKGKIRVIDKARLKEIYDNR